MTTNILFDVTIRNAKPTDKAQRLNDSGGLYLLIKPNGAKWWRFDYTFVGKRKTLSLGVYPATGLADARRKAETARNQISNDIDPSKTRKESKAAQRLVIENESRRRVNYHSVLAVLGISRTSFHNGIKAKIYPAGELLSHRYSQP